jgi:peptidoglycan/xylan/chitin deacetylase (PgdA/CDA1 family)
MLPPTVTRYHFAGMAAVLLSVAALAIGKAWLLVAIIFAFLTLIGFGVALPRMRFFGPFVCQGGTERRCVALTFDDGPDPASTPALLDVLRDARVETAFFCVGERVAANPELARRIIREGHLLENHSYAHRNTTNFFTLARLQSELERTQQVIRDSTGAVSRWFRPPMGLSNPRVFRAARRLGLKVVGWTARGLDTREADPARVVARIRRRLRPGAIILLHDGGLPAERVVANVKSLLDTLHSLGYEVVRLDRMVS